MLKYTKVIDEKTKCCRVGLGNNEAFYQSIGMTLQEVEYAYNGEWYIAGFAPIEPQTEINAREVEKLKYQLNETDYKIIKATEYQLGGLEVPYDIKALHEEREAIRAKIRGLENE